MNIPDENDVVISFSGGRTSGYLLAKLVEEHGSLPSNVHVIFQNTGKEQEATLEFVRDCAKHFDVNIIWLEYSGKKSYKIVDFETASRNGEPFSQLILDKSVYLPNQSQRICTINLKSETMSRYCKHMGYTDIENWLGIRFDEPRRWNVEGIAYKKDKFGSFKTNKHGEKIRQNEIVNEEKFLPLKQMKVTKDDVIKFWNEQPFNLKLGRDESNCDLCFMKGVDNILTMIRRKPERADWWIEQEDICTKHHGKPIGFRDKRPNYRELKRIALEQPDFFADDTDIIPCTCTD